MGSGISMFGGERVVTPVAMSSFTSGCSPNGKPRVTITGDRELFGVAYMLFGGSMGRRSQESGLATCQAGNKAREVIRANTIGIHPFLINSNQTD